MKNMKGGPSKGEEIVKVSCQKLDTMVNFFTSVKSRHPSIACCIQRWGKERESRDEGTLTSDPRKGGDLTRMGKILCGAEQLPPEISS